MTKHKMFAVLMIIMIVMTSTMSMTVHVDAAMSTYTDDHRYSVQSSLDNASAALSKDASGSYGLLYDLRNLVVYAQYVAYAVSYSGSDANCLYTDKEAEYYIRYLRINVSVFNDRFGEDSVRYTALKLSGLPEDANPDDVIKYVDKLSKKAVSYIDRVFTNTENAKNGNSTTGISNGNSMSDVKFEEEYSVLCKNLYMSLNVIIEACNDIRDLRSNRFKATHALTDIVGCIDAAEKVMTKHNELYSLGEELASSDSAGDQIAIDENKHDLENLATVTVDNDGKIHTANDPALDLNYLAILAAGSVYQPFTSYAGDEVFNKALRSLASDGSEASKLLTLYNNNKTLKKPLYKRELDSTGSPTGVAELITLSQFIDDIKNGSAGALVTIKGPFEYDASNGSWLYRPETKNLSTLDAYSDTLIYNNTELDTIVNDSLQGISSTAVSDSYEEGDGSESETDSGDDGPGGVSGDGSDDGSGGVSEAKGLLKPYVLGVKASSVADSTDSGIENITGVVDQNTGTGIGSDDTDTSPNTESALSNDGVASTSDDTSIGNGEAVSNIGSDVNTDNNSVIVDTNKALYAYDSISTVDRMTGPVLLYGATYARDIDNMTTMILTNIINSSSTLDSGRSQSTEFLYMNPFGDIVTQDDLIILPGIANPIMYGHGGTYNPFTVAFMNSYPSILNNTSYFQLATKADIGKYLIFLQLDHLGDDELQLNSDNKVSNVDTLALDKEIKNFNSGSELGSDVSLSAGILSSRYDVRQSAPVKTMNIATDFISNSYDTFSVFAVQRLIFGADNNWDEKNPLFTYTPLVIKNSLVINGRNVFPYRSTTDTDQTIANAIADNMFQFLAVDRVSGEIGNCGRLNDNWILHFMLINGIEGTNNARGYTDSLLFQYTKYTEDAANRAVLRLVDLSRMLVNGTTDVDGVIGWKNAYEDPILGKVLLFIRQYWVFALLMFVILLLMSFARFKRDMFQTIVIFVSSIAIAFLFVTIVPVYLPMVYNSVLYNLSDTFLYKILAQKAEYVDASDDAQAELNDDGNYKYDTGSITLYRKSNLDLRNMYDLIGIDESEVSAGKSYIINQGAGMFLQGDSIKINTDVLFKTLKIDGSIAADASYKLKASKIVSNNLDYYTPYYQIVDNFIDKLNLLSEVYNIPESTKTYSNGKSKNNYLVYCYLNSQPFLNAGSDYHYELPLDRTGWSEESIEEYENTNNAVCMQLEESFGDNIDWLGISDLLFNEVLQYGSKYQNSLWLRTLVQNGYYKRNSDGTLTPNEEMLETLVTYVNYQTKHFVFGMGDITGIISDDVMVKIIALRALIALNQKASVYSNWLYPFCVNYQEFSLKDILDCMFIKDFDKYIESGMDIVEYVRLEYGWFHLVIFDLVVLLLFLIVNVMKVLMAAMYISFAVVVLLRMGKTGEIKVPVKGYVKCTSLILICSTVLCLTVTFLRRLNYSVIALYALLLIIILVVYVLTSIISALMSNFMELGDGRLMAELTGGVHSLHGVHSSRFNRVSVGHVGVGRRHRRFAQSYYNTRRRPSFSNYSINRSYNDYYGYSGYNDYGYGGYDDFDGYDGYGGHRRPGGSGLFRDYGIGTETVEESAEDLVVESDSEILDSE